MAAADALGASPWSVPFDPEDPVHTPHTLDIAAPFVAQALADAVLELDAAGIPADARLGDDQHVVRNGDGSARPECEGRHRRLMIGC